jgi:hypothetical protein
MEDWYTILTPILGLPLGSPSVLKVNLAYRAPSAGSLQPRWVRNGSTLEAPSPHQGTLTLGDTPTPELRQLMAYHMVDGLIEQQSGERALTAPGPVVSALRAELRDWAVKYLGSAAREPFAPVLPATPLLDAIVAGAEMGKLPALVISLDGSQTLDEVVAAAGITPPDVITRLAFHIAALDRALFELDEDHYRTLVDPETAETWRRGQIGLVADRRQITQAGQMWPVPSSLRVTSVVFNAPFAWVATETETHDGALYSQTVFLRQVDDQWKLTAPDPAFLGERRETQTENLRFLYYEADAAWFEERIPGQMQRALEQASADLDIPTGGLLITLVTNSVPGASAIRSTRTPRVRFPSPSIDGWRIDRPDPEELRVAVEILGALLETRISASDGEDMRFVMAHVGAYFWEIERLFPRQADWETWFDIGIGPVRALELSELWELPRSEPGDGMRNMVWSGYRALFHFLSETYGPEVVPALLYNVSGTDNLDEWLRLATGHGLDEVEPAWHVWVADYYAE